MYIYDCVSHETILMHNNAAENVQKPPSTAL